MECNLKKIITLNVWLTAILFMIQLMVVYDSIEEMLISGSTYKLISFCLSCIGKSICVSSFIMVLFNKYAWKWKFIKFLHDTPVLKSKYIGTFNSTYDNKKRHGTMYINQTFLNVTVQLKTDESQSRSIVTFLEKYQGVYHLVYVYQNEPRAEIQERSPIHYGTAILDVSNSEVLNGNYFTGRKTIGSMSFQASDT